MLQTVKSLGPKYFYAFSSSCECISRRPRAHTARFPPACLLLAPTAASASGGMLSFCITRPDSKHCSNGNILWTAKPWFYDALTIQITVTAVYTSFSTEVTISVSFTNLPIIAKEGKEIRFNITAESYFLVNTSATLSVVRREQDLAFWFQLPLHMQFQEYMFHKWLVSPIQPES